MAKYNVIEYQVMRQNWEAKVECLLCSVEHGLVLGVGMMGGVC
jgi:hypothetical protein